MYYFSTTMNSNGKHIYEYIILRIAIYSLENYYGSMRQRYLEITTVPVHINVFRIVINLSHFIKARIHSQF